MTKEEFNSLLDEAFLFAERRRPTWAHTASSIEAHDPALAELYRDVVRAHERFCAHIKKRLERP